MTNIFSSIPEDLSTEIFEDLLVRDSFRIEKILSKGQSIQGDNWYDQEENEWVIVLDGSGTIVYEDGSEVKLGKGDFLNIPAHRKHKVKFDEPNNVTVWLAIFYK